MGRGSVRSAGVRGCAVSGRELTAETAVGASLHRRIPSPGRFAATLSLWERVGVVAAAGEEAGDGDVLVERLPMQAEGADLHRPALLRRGVEEAREPGERHAEDAAIGEVDPPREVV
jgi:hypothetical protein